MSFRESLALTPPTPHSGRVLVDLGRDKDRTDCTDSVSHQVSGSRLLTSGKCPEQLQIRILDSNFESILDSWDFLDS